MDIYNVIYAIQNRPAVTAALGWLACGFRTEKLKSSKKGKLLPETHTASPQFQSHISLDKMYNLKQHNLNNQYRFLIKILYKIYLKTY